jgi:putative NADPH-quinone reductase
MCFPNGMCSKQTKILYTVGFRLNLGEIQLNQMGKGMYKWRGLEEELQKLEKNEFSIFVHPAVWSDLEAEVKNWITQQKHGISVSSK